MNSSGIADVKAMKRFVPNLLFALFTFCVGIVAFVSSSFFRCERASMTESWKTYASEEYGYRLRYPDGWKLRSWSEGGEVYLCSPRIKFPCGPTPHEVYATVGLGIRDPEGLTLAEYLRSPARGYKDLRELRVGGVHAFATGPVEGDPDRFLSSRFIEEQVHLLHRGKVYTITAYAVDPCPREFEQLLTTFEVTK